MNDERLDDYLAWLDDINAPASDLLEWLMPSFDEWNAERLAAGLPAGTITEYRQSIETGEYDVQQGS